MKIAKDILADLRLKALAAAEQAYAPYSGIHVGAALLANNGGIYTGCNVENASYGLTICAERSAVSAAMLEISDKRESLIRAIYIVSSLKGAIPPCGACRQVIFEFGKGGLVFFPAQKGVKKIKVSSLLPEAFHL
jgi:cytidine deaminase